MARKKQFPVIPKTLGECVVGDYVEIDGKQARFSFFITGTPYFRWLEHDPFEDEWVEARELTKMPENTPVKLIRRTNHGGDS